MKQLGIILLLIVFLGCSTQVHAIEPGKFIIVLLDQLSLQEVHLFAGEEFEKIIEQSCLALVNARTDKGIGSDYSYLAFGAGNRGKEYGAIPGLMGKLLTENDYKIAIFGNSDYKLNQGRQVMTIVENDVGHLFFAKVDESILHQDPGFPGEMRSDYETMGQLFINKYSDYDLFLLEIGDFNRIKTSRRNREIDLLVQGDLVKSSLQRLDKLLKIITKKMDWTNDRLMLVSPTPDLTGPHPAIRLSWVMVTGAIDSGVLSVDTTRRPGLVTISDLAPSILDYFQVTPPQVMTGHPTYVRPKLNLTVQELINWQHQIYRTAEWRPWFIKEFIFIQIVLLATAITTFLVRKIVPTLWWKTLAQLFLVILFIPGIFLLFSSYLMVNFTIYLAMFIVFLIFCSLLVKRFISNPFPQLLAVINLTVLLLIWDLLQGAPLMARSLLGYCPVIGARYYGIGNEFMGILVGGTLLGWTGLLDLFPQLENRKIFLTPIVFTSVIAIIALPMFGANFGGTLTAMAAFTFTYVLDFPKKKRLGICLKAIGVMMLFLSLIIIGDTLGWIGVKSHLGQTVDLLKEEGIQAFLTIISRKLSMNLKLLRWTIWTRVLLSFIVVLFIFFKRPMGSIQELVQEFPNFTRGFLGVLLGSVVTMMVNDSGVVAAATLLFFAIHSLLYLILKNFQENYILLKKI